MVHWIRLSARCARHYKLRHREIGAVIRRLLFLEIQAWGTGHGGVLRLAGNLGHAGSCELFRAWLAEHAKRMTVRSINAAPRHAVPCRGEARSEPVHRHCEEASPTMRSSQRPSSRGAQRRSDLLTPAVGSRDCFAAFAMTGTYLSSLRGGAADDAIRSSVTRLLRSARNDWNLFIVVARRHRRRSNLPRGRHREERSDEAIS